MPIHMYFLIAYLVIINIVTLITYAKEIKQPSPRISAIILLSLPVIGGSFGAILANYFFNTSNREIRHYLVKGLTFLPPVMFILQFVIIIYFIGVGNFFSVIWDFAYQNAGIIGCIFLIINSITFVLLVVRKSAYFFAPNGYDLIPDVILVSSIVLGGATGVLFGKILFNFKFDGSCNVTLKVQNFMYGIGVYLFTFLQIGIMAYFFFIK